MERHVFNKKTHPTTGCVFYSGLAVAAGGCFFFEGVHFFEDEHQRQYKGKTIGHRASPKHTEDAHAVAEQHHCRNEKENLAAEGDQAGTHRFANGLEEDGAYGLEAVEEAK